MYLKRVLFIRTDRGCLALFIVGVLLIGVVTWGGFTREPFFFERLIITLVPTAERAYAFGDAHFSSDSQHYSVEHAEYFYHKALKLNPKYPFANHQLARIAFLHGDFDEALVLINKEFELTGGEPLSYSSYYIRALINAYAGDYESAQEDYGFFIARYPTNWAAINDYAWVLLQDKQFSEAEKITAYALQYHADNVWLLNTNAIALYEMGEIQKAHQQMLLTVRAATKLDDADWLYAYPGNDPRTARDGVRSFQDSVIHNMHMIALAAQKDGYNDQ